MIDKSEFQSKAITLSTKIQNHKYSIEEIFTKHSFDNYFLITLSHIKIYLYIDQYDIFANEKLIAKVEADDVASKDELFEEFTKDFVEKVVPALSDQRGMR